MERNEFIKKLKGIKSAKSVTGKEYRSIYVYSDRIEFIREGKISPERISISELYELYSNESSITTTIAKSYISGRVQSPAVAILNQLKNISSAGKIYDRTVNDNILPYRKETKTNTKSATKDETKFFKAFSEIIGEQFLQSKSINKPVKSEHVILSNNYMVYSFNQEIIDCYEKILTDLKSNKIFSSDSLSHHVDGVIINHPILKTRIIEFDEEQHFTPARRDTLKYLSNIMQDNYFSKYDEICSDKNYLNDYVLKKHRIKNKLANVPNSFIEFTKWLAQSNEKSSGYICEKNGFDFLGGRIAQRAYYDCLRDTAHLSEKNKDFECPLRFAKKQFEDIENAGFELIPIDRIKNIILEILAHDYKIKI